MLRASSLAGLSPLNCWSRVWVPYGCARGMKMEFWGTMSRSRLSQHIPPEEADIQAHSHSCEALGQSSPGTVRLRLNVLAQMGASAVCPTLGNTVGGPSSPSYLRSAGCWVLELPKPPKELTIKQGNHRAARPPSRLNWADGPQPPSGPGSSQGTSWLSLYPGLQTAVALAPGGARGGAGGRFPAGHSPAQCHTCPACCGHTSAQPSSPSLALGFWLETGRAG